MYLSYFLKLMLIFSKLRNESLVLFKKLLVEDFCPGRGCYFRIHVILMWGMPSSIKLGPACRKPTPS